MRTKKNGEPAKVPSGRPSSYSQATVDYICQQMSEGRSLRKICQDEAMPAQATIFRWLADPERRSFREQYARAREAMADAVVDEAMEIADNSQQDTLIGEDGAEKANHEWIARSRLRVDMRKWYAGKVAPKKYGERLELAGDAESPLTVQILRYGDDTPAE
jgi:hypothetical protein